MSWLDDLDPAHARLILDAAEELARYVWRKLTGGEASTDEVIAKIRDAAIEEMAAQARHEAMVIGVEMGYALGKLGGNAEGVVAAMRRAAERSSVPVIAAEIREVLDIHHDESAAEVALANAAVFVASAGPVALAAWDHCGCAGCAYCNAVQSAITAGA